MLRFEREVLIADLAERTIEGVIVPYGEVGSIQGRDYRFRPGSVRIGRRVPFLVDHDRGRPIGVLAELVEGDRGVLARFRVDATAAGDEALTQAASGSRGALSVGAEVVESTIARDGVIEVEAANVLETSLLALGAFDGATVTRVAAEADDPPPEGGDEADEEGDGEGTPDDAPSRPAEPGEGQEELELEPEPDEGGDAAEPDPEEGEEMTATQEASPRMILAERSPSPAELGAGELVRYLVEAQHGNREAARFLEAALTESISTDVGGLLPPTYERTVIGAKTTPRPLYGSFQSRPLPGVGLQVNKPVWTTPPNGAWAATVDADATSTKVVVGSQAATVQRWDWAGAIPWVVVQRSDPSIVDEIYAAAIQDWYYDVEAKIEGELNAAPAATSTTLGAAIAEFWVACKRAPETIIVAPDVWGTMADANELSHPIAAGDVSAGGELRSTFAGIPIVANGAQPAGSAYLATRRAVDARITDPVRLTANAIGALNVELAVVGEGLFDTDYPTELLAIAAVTFPAAMGGGGSTRKASS